MEEAAQQEQDPSASTGERPAESTNLREQQTLLEDERPSRLVGDQPISSDATGDFNAGYPLQADASFDQPFYHGGYNNSSGYWDGYPHYVNAASMLVLPLVIHHNNASFMFNSGYGFNPPMAYGQYTAVAIPPCSLIVDWQLYLPHQNPFSPHYNPQPVSDVQNISSTLSVSQNFAIGPGSSNYQGLVGPANSLPSQLNLQEADGMLGSYEHNVRQRAVHGVGLVPSSYGSTNMGGASTSLLGVYDRNRITLDKVKMRDRNRSSGVFSADLHNFSSYCSRGPRAGSKPKDQNTSRHGVSSSSNNNDSSNPVVHSESYNQPDFAIDYENAMFFIIKSFSEDNVHRSIKYSVWASTALGNQKLDAAYHKAKEMETNCPIFLYFSVNSSSQFCGVAEMVGPVNFVKDAEYWQQDWWSGLFPVKWHIIKDIPNSLLRHILLENNENKPVTCSRDIQEVNLEQGIQMLKIFKSHVAHTSILEDFDFYEQRERASKEKKARQQACSTSKSPVPESSINQFINSFSQAVQLEEKGREVTPTELGGNSRTESWADCSVAGGIVLEPERGCSFATGELGSPADDHEPNV